LVWFDKNKRDLPWRENFIGLIISGLSEIISSTNQGRPGYESYYLKFIRNFSKCYKHLAEANQQDVLKLWQGLGYYSQGPETLHKGAKYLMNRN
jgi:A/G-specific adenine glycosylase